MNWRTAPLPAIWPNGARTGEFARKYGQFRVSAEATMKMLEKELVHLGVRYSDTVVLMAGYRERDIRQDGRPRADARQTGDPGVAIAFESKHGPLTYACDTYRAYSDNLRAIALGLEALRAVDRYGISKSGQQYTGWKALGSGDATVADGVRQRFTRTTAARFVADHATEYAESDKIMASPGYGRDAFREVAKKLHPDAGGSREDWDRLQEAKAVLGL